jgi:hypothetical protein
MHRLFIALILLSSTTLSNAAEVNSLYQAQAPVSSRDEAERNALASPLLRQVMLKVVGNAALLDATDVSSVLAQANSFVQRYEYQRTNILDYDLTQPDELALKLSFDGDAVNQAIQQVQLPVWGKKRPDILVWAIVEISDETSIVGLETDGLGIIQPLSAAAESRGLPILLPLMDLEDQTALTASDIKDSNHSKLEKASARYQADIILTALIEQQADSVTVRWQANGRGMTESWQDEGLLKDALAQGVGTLADKLALRYTQRVESDQPQQRLNLRITNVMGFADYNRLMQFLDQMELVTDIQVANLSEQQLDLNIAFQGSEALLQRMLSVGNLLSEQATEDGSDAKHYRLIP